MSVYDFRRGSLPLLISIPHSGTQVPESIAERFTAAGRALPDTDWFVDRLYAFAGDLGASIIQANHSRYVVDLNRAPDSAALYVTDPTSPVCPTSTFAGEVIYRAGQEPDTAEISARVDQYWRPYHDRIDIELQRMRARHGVALLWDAHSIASEIPGLFAGVLPEFNFGTRDDASCPRCIGEELLDHVVRDGRYGAVLNGRFLGGYITLHHGRPAEGIYAVQLELAQRAYMIESPARGWNPEYARNAARLLSDLLPRFVQAGRRAATASSAQTPLRR